MELIRPANVVMLVSIYSDRGAVNSASPSSIMQVGLALGSNNSNLNGGLSSITAAPPRFTPFVGVVSTTICGIFGSDSLGLSGGRPGVYFVHNS